jgi:high affinity Mn2+ porin
MNSKHQFSKALLMILCGLCLSQAAVAASGMTDGSATLPAPSTEPSATSETPIPETWSFHGQMTNVTQWQPAFTAPYSGTNSLDPRHRSAETTDLTLFMGARLWQGGELYINPEYDQGFGLSNTLGAAGFPSGEAYKVGANTPYPRLPRAFLRQVIELGGDARTLDPGANQLGGSVLMNNVTVTVGKFSTVDMFDTNTYAHDPRADFMNWSVVDAGAFDYAADAWGFTYGLAVEWTQSWWTLRGGFFDLSEVPNSKILDKNFSQYEWVSELETRHQILNHPGKIKLLGFVNHGNMGDYSDAVRLAQQTGAAPDTALVRRFASRPGFAINVEQEVASDLGIFVRASLNDGSKEAFEFTEINRSISAGLSLKGDRWGRHDDTLGIAAAVNGLSGAAREYFAAGGMGILIGDGQLNYNSETILETYYNWNLMKDIWLAADYQHITNPAYNADRGPVHIIGARLHLEY